MLYPKSCYTEPCYEEVNVYSPLKHISLTACRTILFHEKQGDLLCISQYIWLSFFATYVVSGANQNIRDLLLMPVLSHVSPLVDT